jgi:hypothetical protein
VTIPSEEKSALEAAEKFLVLLISPGAYPGVPSQVREEAKRIIRHFPTRARIKSFFPEIAR